jgi:hypothetical protein
MSMSKRSFEHILSNLQLELLKLYANNISENQLIEIKLLLANYFAQQATRSLGISCGKHKI